MERYKFLLSRRRDRDSWIDRHPAAYGREARATVVRDVQVLALGRAPQPHVAGGDQVRRAGRGEDGGADDGEARRIPGLPRPGDQPRASDDGSIVLQYPAGGAGEDELDCRNRPGPDRDLDARRSPIIGADHARRDSEGLASRLAAVVRHGVDRATRGFEGRDRCTRGQPADPDAGPGRSPVVSRPQLRAERPAVGRIRKPDGRNAVAREIALSSQRRARRRDRRPRRATVRCPDDCRATGILARDAAQDPAIGRGNERRRDGLEAGRDGAALRLR